MSNLPDTKNVQTINATGKLASLNRCMMNDQSSRSTALYRLLPNQADALLFICWPVESDVSASHNIFYRFYSFSLYLLNIEPYETN